MKYFTRHAVTLLAIFLSIQVSSAQATAEDDAEELADVIREFNEAFGDIVDGEMTATQIAEFERMITPAFDVEKIHIAQCSMVAYASIVNATIIATARLNPALSEMADEVRGELVTGSIRDWLVRFSIPLVHSLGFERSLAATSYQCQQKKYAFAMHPDLEMNSLEMIAAENCLLNQIC